MKLFLGFLLCCFFGGIVLQRLHIRTLMLLVAVLCVLASIGYYFFDQI